MKKLIGLMLTFATVLAACAPSYRANPYSSEAYAPRYNGSTKTLLVIPLKGNIYQNYLDGGQGTLEEIINAGAYGDRFVLIDREALNVALRDFKLSSIGLLDESSSTQLGKQLGAQVALSGTVSGLNTESEQGGDGKYGYYTNYTTKAQASLKLLNVETGVVMAASTGTGSVYSSKNKGNQDDLKAVNAAVRNAANSLIRTYAARWDGKE